MLDLVEFIKEFKEEREHHIPEVDVVSITMVNGEWWFDPTACNGSFNDFNKEILHPDSPIEGLVGVRVDDNFWLVAMLPYEYKDIDIKDIVQVLWPHLVEKAIFEPDYIANRSLDALDN